MYSVSNEIGVCWHAWVPVVWLFEHGICGLWFSHTEYRQLKSQKRSWQQQLSYWCRAPLLSLGRLPQSDCRLLAVTRKWKRISGPSPSSADVLVELRQTMARKLRWRCWAVEERFTPTHDPLSAPASTRCVALTEHWKASSSNLFAVSRTFSITQTNSVHAHSAVGLINWVTVNKA